MKKQKFLHLLLPVLALLLSIAAMPAVLAADSTASIAAFETPMAADLTFTEKPAETDLLAQLPETVEAELTTGETIALPVTWTLDSDTTFDESDSSLFLYWAAWDEDQYPLSDAFNYNQWPFVQVYLTTDEDSAASAETTAGMTSGVANILHRAYQQTNIAWTPVEDVDGYLNSAGELTAVFKAGVTYYGLPYGMLVGSGKYVPFRASFDTFLDAVNTSGSIFYTTRGWYGKRTCTYYATDCSAFVSYCYAVSKRTCEGFVPSSVFTAINGLENIQIGDCLNKHTSHIMLFTNIVYDDAGNVRYYEISQETPPKTKVSLYTPEQIQELIDEDGYVITRYNNRNSVTEPVSYTGYSIKTLLNDAAEVSLTFDSEAHDCLDNQPTVTVTYGGTVLTEGTDYTVSISDDVVPGSAAVTVTGTGDYEGTAYAVYGVTGWSYVNGVWRYFDNGTALTGAQVIDGKKYLFDETGCLSVGWKQVNGAWYYTGSDGYWVTGWLTYKGSRYYFGSDGVMQTGWVEDNGAKYYFGSDGTMQTGWVEDGGHRYYFAEDGVLETELWLNADGSWYYLGSDGAVQTGWIKDAGKWYYLDETGVMQTGWVLDNGSWYYLTGSGAMKTGWLKYSGKWYYLTGSGAMKTGWLKNSGAWYYLGSDGAMLKGWQIWNGDWYYFVSSGEMQTGWLTWKSHRYYLNSDGAMVTGTQTIGGTVYTFSADGALVS